jgi:thioredoxin reductase (NADPH)
MSETETAPTAHVLIIGGGAAGTSCALFLARAGITSQVFHHDRTILKRAHLHNFPGIDPVLGVDWLDKLRAQVAATGASTLELARVTAAGREGEGVFVETPGGRVTGDYLVIASGQLSIPFAEGIGLETTEAIQPYVTVNITTDRFGATNVDRIFATGVVAGFPSQAVVCAGAGANTAVRIASLVRQEFWVDHDVAEVPQPEAEV